MAKIIWIDDNNYIMKSVIYPLQQAGHLVLAYRTPGEARENMAEVRSADVIILDMLLPDDKEMSEEHSYFGEQFFQELRETHHITAPIIAFTVRTDNALKQRLKDLGAADILHKPILPSKLKESVEAVLDKQP
jgi:DNA-binding response OmpR family regulator